MSASTSTTSTIAPKHGVQDAITELRGDSPFWMNQMLDIWIEPDKSWRWKDWDELVEAERVGLFTPDQAAAIRAEGRRVIDSLDTLLPTGWEDWQPDPSWSLPTLPEGWDRIDDVVVRHHSR